MKQFSHFQIPLLIAVASTIVTSGCGDKNLKPLFNAISGKCYYLWDRALITYFAPNAPLSDGTSDASNVSLSYNVWVMKQDGSGKAALTNNNTSGVHTFFPTPAPNGEAFYFTSTMGLSGATNAPAETTYNLWKVTRDGTSKTPLTRNLNLNHTDGSTLVSPFGNKLVISSRLNLSGNAALGPESPHNIWLLDLETLAFSHLTAATENNCENNARSFSPDGTQILFSSRMALSGIPTDPCLTVDNVWIMNSDGSGKIPLTRNTANKSIPANMSTDGKKVIFYSNQPINGVPSQSDNIWIMNSDGSGQIALTTETAALRDSRVYGTAINPNDGSKIVYISKKPTTNGHGGASQPYNLWVMNIDGTNQIALTTSIISTTFVNIPTFSPDGTKIFFLNTAQPPGLSPWITTQNLWSVNVDGSGSTALTTNSNGNNIRTGTNDYVYLPKTCF